jgi:hypothetical protein
MQTESTRLVDRLRKTPLVVSGILVQLLRYYLAENSVQFRPGTSSATENLTRDDALLVTTHDNFDLNITQVRPAVIIKRLAMQYRRLVMNDQLTRAKDGSTNAKVMLVSGGYQLLCLSKNSGEVERLAEEVSEVLISFKEEIRQDFNFTRFDFADIGETGIIEESEEVFAIPCAVLIEFTESWETVRIGDPTFTPGRVSFEFKRQLDAEGIELFPSDPVERGCLAAELLFQEKRAGIASGLDSGRKPTAERAGLLYTNLGGGSPDQVGDSALKVRAGSMDPVFSGYGESLYGDGEYGR